MSYQYKPLPKNPCGWGWDTGTKRIYQVLGIKNNVIPKNMHGVFKIDGYTVIIKRSGPAAKGGKPRMFIDFGGREVPAGRVYQAMCRRDIHHARKRAKALRSTGGRFSYRKR